MITRIPRLVRRRQERLEVLQCAVTRMNRSVIRDVVTVVAQRRRIKGQQPDGGDSQFLQIIEPLRQAGEIADAVAVAVAKRAHVQLINDGIFVPEVVPRWHQSSTLLPALRNPRLFPIQVDVISDSRQVIQVTSMSSS